MNEEIIRLQNKLEHQAKKIRELIESEKAAVLERDEIARENNTLAMELDSAKKIIWAAAKSMPNGKLELPDSIMKESNDSATLLGSDYDKEEGLTIIEALMETEQ